MSVTLRKPRAIIFDWDNTLVDSWHCIQKCYNETFRHFGMPEWSMEETRISVARSLRDTFPAMFGDRWEEARDVFYFCFEKMHLSHLRAMDGAEDMLRTLAYKGLYLAIVSNKVSGYLRAEVAALGWSHLFSQLVGATDAVADKPDAAPVHLALGSFSLVPGPAVWFVGDAPIDMQCAANANCTSVLLRSAPPLQGEFGPYPPMLHILSCSQLSDLVSELLVSNSKI